MMPLRSRADARSAAFFGRARVEGQWSNSGLMCAAWLVVAGCTGRGSLSKPTAAPRPFMVIGGLQDPRNAMGGVMLVMNAATASYTRAGAADHIQIFTANVGHDGTYAPFHQQAEQWLDKWLGNHAPAGK